MILQRILSNDNGTFGVLTFSGNTLVTCEDPWNNNQRHKSCIPPGEYTCVPYSSEKYHDVWILMDVPGRDHILIHSGNTIKDTEGCILPGVWFGELSGNRAVIQSRDALNIIRKQYSGQSFKLAIRGIQ